VFRLEQRFAADVFSRQNTVSCLLFEDVSFRLLLLLSSSFFFVSSSFFFSFFGVHVPCQFLTACHVRVTVGDHGLCCCVPCNSCDVSRAELTPFVDTTPAYENWFFVSFCFLNIAILN